MDNIRYMISDAASLVNVESHVLRYWEVELELDIPRNEMGHRYYTEENLRQFQQIKSWKEEGYQLKAIRMMVHNEKPGKENAVHKKEVEVVKEERKQVMEQQGNRTELTVEKTQKNVSANKNAASNTVKMEQFQALMTSIVRNAIAENNFDLSQEVGDQVGEKVLKEMNYLMRVQDEAEEERFRKLDEAIRGSRKRGRKAKAEKEPKTGRFFNKEKKLNPNLNI